MPDPRISNLARTLVEYSTRVKPGDHVAIMTQPVAMPLAEEVYRFALKAGGYPYVQLGGLRSRVETETLEYLLFTEGSEDQIQHVNRFVKEIREEFEVMIVLVMTLFPTDAYAQDAEMSLEEFESYVFSTTYADTEDTISAWRKIHDEQQRLVDWLDGKKQLSVKGPHVDLELSIEGRKFINSDGTHNMPSGEIYTSPVEDSVNGWIRFSYPAIRQAREVEGIELTFEAGRVVKATAQKNEAFLQSMLDTDEGARYLGEFAIGTNKRIDRFIKNILFDEKIGGTIHMAVGFGFPEAGGKNESAIHWDMICDMREGGQIFADGELFYESGEFKI